jgi:hypothetical protein
LPWRAQRWARFLGRMAIGAARDAVVRVSGPSH